MIKKDSIFARLVISNVVIIIIVTLSISFMSFYISKKLIIETFASSNSKMLEQINTNLIDFHTQIVAISNNVRLNKSLKKFLISKPSNELDLYGMLYGMQNYYKSFNPSIHYYNLHIVTVGVNGLAYASNIESPIIDSEEINNNFLSSHSQSSTILYNFHPTGITTSIQDKGIVVASKVLEDESNKKPYGVLLIALEETNFSQIYNQSIATGNTISIIGRDGNIISSSNKNVVGNIDKVLYEHSTHLVRENLLYKNIHINNTDYILLANYVPYLDCYIVNTIDVNLALAPIWYLKNFIFVFSIFIVMLTIIVIFFISRKISLPLSEMVKVMSTIPDENFSDKICIDGSYEVRVLGRTFNSMVSEIKKYINQLIKEQEERRKAELYALQMQINPHFLYNTLSSIKYLAWHGNSDQVATTINALISLLQNTIGKVDETIPIKEEIENLKNYVIIIQTRYGDNIEVSFDVDPVCESYMIPKLILQPFIENAFFHGFKNTTNGVIRVYIHPSDDTLICEIIDNGDGIETHKLHDLSTKEQRKKHFTGIGIKNVDERIKIIYGSCYGVSITSEVGLGTCVTVQLPIASQ